MARVVGPHDVQVERQRQGGGVPQRLADGAGAEAVREVEVVHRGERGGGLRATGRVDAGRVAEVRRAPGLVERGPHRHAVAVGVDDLRGVVGEAQGGVAHGPAAGVLEGLRQVPVVHRGHRVDAGRQEVVDQPVVEVEAGGVERARAGGLDPRPGEREPVGVQAEVDHVLQVLGRAVVVVARDGARVARVHLAGSGGVGVPDGREAPVLGRRTLDLVRRRRGAPDEVGREGAGGVGRRRHGHILTRSNRFAMTGPAGGRTRPVGGQNSRAATSSTPRIAS